MKSRKPRRPPRKKKKSDAVYSGSGVFPTIDEESIEPPRNGANGGRNILLIDDNRDQLLLFSTLIGNAGFGVLQATSAREGLDTVNSRPVDLIVCDVMMPEMSGVEFLRHLRGNTHSSKIPVVMVSAGCEATEMDLMRAGADTFCAKSRIKRDLLQQVRLLLD